MASSLCHANSFEEGRKSQLQLLPEYSRKDISRFYSSAYSALLRSPTQRLCISAFSLRTPISQALLQRFLRTLFKNLFLTIVSAQSDRG